MDLHVADVGHDVVVVTLLVLRVYIEIRHVGIRLLRTGHVVLANALEVQHCGVEGAVVWITGSVANGHLCNVGSRMRWQMFALFVTRTHIRTGLPMTRRKTPG